MGVYGRIWAYNDRNCKKGFRKWTIFDNHNKLCLKILVFIVKKLNVNLRQIQGYKKNLLNGFEIMDVASQRAGMI